MGKGGGKGHTPREAKDNLKSTQMMSVIDAIGEGPVEGPVKGLQSILVNKTPLTDTDGNPVIHGVTAVWRAGEQEQTPPEGFESSGAETALGVEVTKAKPVTRTITSANIDRLRVTFGVQSLVETTSKGDRNPSSVRLLIQLERNGHWVTEKDITINGKTTSQYLTSVILNNLPERPFNIRMVRETAKPAYSNNPAWCLWDMLTHPRYGMGKRLGAADVDKWALYAIGQYCDQTVPDGFGGTEPRMTFNAYLSQQRKVWDVLGDFCSAMRCMPVWNGQTLTFVQDRPSDVVWPYTNSDVVVDDNGVGFRYSFSALKDRHTAVEVNYTDPQNGWQTSTELVEDPDAILRYGRNLLKMDA
ncbi:host specificity protein J, partial [Escherichia coli]|nr:host specificity protein J [Escherichia coli]